MKKIFTILCAVVLTFHISAQTAKGTWMISGATGLDFSSASINDADPGYAWSSGQESTSSVLDMKLLGGTFLTDGLLLGIQIGYKNETTENDNGDGAYIQKSETSETTLMISPTMRYYFSEAGVWAQISYGFGSVTEEQDTEYAGDAINEYKSELDLTVFTISGGYAIYLSDNISLNPTIGYAMSTATIEDGAYDPIYGYTEDLEYELSGFTFGLALSISLAN